MAQCKIPLQHLQQIEAIGEHGRMTPITDHRVVAWLLYSEKKQTARFVEYRRGEALAMLCIYSGGTMRRIPVRKSAVLLLGQIDCVTRTEHGNFILTGQGARDVTSEWFPQYFDGIQAASKRAGR